MLKQPIKKILEKITSEHQRMTVTEGEILLNSPHLAEIASAADTVCRHMHPEPWRTYNIDRNINYTNICQCRCYFCAFSRDAHHADAYVITKDELLQKIQQTVDLGGSQILLQGGLNPELRLSWFEQLFREIKSAFPGVNIHGLTPTEILFLSKLENLPEETVLDRLASAGLGSLPGGGAEILVDSVRKKISPKKIMTEDWLRIHELWHLRGGRSTATMMFGHVETPAERMKHLEHIRNLQDKTGGFTAFIPWTYQPVPRAIFENFSPDKISHKDFSHTDFLSAPPKKTEMDMSRIPAAGTFAYLKMLAVSRLFLDNISNIQVSWVTQGMKIGELALSFGANDMGSLMIEENVVAACGTTFFTTETQLKENIRRAGFLPRRRNVFYQLQDFISDE
ncbi:MAG: radical SAM protein [Planctomycetia bacterium]|nr:radical SAM protein [Planctomycetia bacterium]